MPGLLYPAYQKLYSALSSLERFNKEENFFDNITAIDSFFNEYRNITFVLQSSLKHTEFFSVYEKNRDMFLTDHWFVEKRNETIKQKPFQLIKEIKVTLYLPFGGFTVCERTYSVEDDMPLESLLSDLKEMLRNINEYEVCFSVSFFFHEESSNIDLIEKLLRGISSMKKFMEAMENDIGDECPVCKQLKDKIHKKHFADVPVDFLSVTDYVYYPNKDLFDRSQRLSLSMGDSNKLVADRRPLSEITQAKVLNYDGTAFGNVTLSHVIMQRMQKNTDIMPLLMVIYDDQTYDLDVFAADTKTTMYRKVNEIAQKINDNDISEVCFLSLYTSVKFNKRTPKTSFKRIKKAKTEFLVSASINKLLIEKEYIFERSRLDNMDYIVHVMKNELNNHFKITSANLFPIRQAFANKAKMNSN